MATTSDPVSGGIIDRCPQSAYRTGAVCLTVYFEMTLPYYHFRKWSADGSLQRLFNASLISARGELNLSELHLDGSHSVAKKGAKA
jgi:hypothetical protein